MESIEPGLKQPIELVIKKNMKTIERQVLRDIFKSIDKREGAIVLTGPAGIGKSSLITQTVDYLRKKSFEFIVVQGSTTVEQILEAISIKAGTLGLDYAEKIFDSFDDPEGKMTWYLDRFLLKQKVVIIFNRFEENQDEEKAGEFKQERLKKFLWFSRDRLKYHESFLLFSTRYTLPGFDTPGMTINIPGLSTREFRKMLLNSKALKHLDEKSTETLCQDIGGSPWVLELLDQVAYQEYKQGDFTWEQIKESILGAREQMIQKKAGEQDFIHLLLETLLCSLDKPQRKLLDVLAVYGNLVPGEAIAAHHVVMKEEDRAKLADLSLLECIDWEGKELYTVHDLTAQYLVETMNETQRKKYHRTAAQYFEAFPEEEGKLYLHNRIEARRHYLQARQWERAAELTADLSPYLMERGYLVCAVELLRELEMKKLSEKNRAEIHSCLGSIHVELSEYENALSRCTAALEIAKKIKDLKSIASYMNQIGNIYYKEGDFDYAFGQYRQALEISDKIGDYKEMAYSLHQIGIIHQFQGNYDAAFDNVKKSLEIKEKIADTLGIAKSLLQIGIFYYYKRDYDAALAGFQESKAVYGKIAHFRGVKGVAGAWHWFGMVYQAKGNYDAALDSYRKSNEEFEKIADFKDMCYNFYRIGLINKDKGNYDAALNNLEKAKEVYEKNGAIRDVCNCLYEIGKVNQTRSDYEATLKYFLQAFLQYTKIGDPDANPVRDDIARVRGKLPEEQFNSILQEFNVTADFLDNEDDREQEQFVEFLAALTRDAAASREKNSEEKEQLSARLNGFIEKLSDNTEGRDLKSYFRLLLAVVNEKDYREYLEEISEGLKELFEEVTG
jgi:tetratricopeptide (TPR) repeat protein/GTPase SAR1 family protein